MTPEEYFKEWAENCRIFIDYKPIHNHEDMMRFAKDYHEKQLLLHNVSQQRELLIDCVNFCDGLDLIENSTVEEQVDSYLLSINCG